MKKIYTFIVMLSILCSCSKDMNDIEIPEGSEPTKQYNMVQTTFSATIDQSRAYLDNNHVYWEEGDKVGVIDNISKNVNSFTVVSVENNHAVLSGEVPEGSTQFAAVYPESAATSADFTKNSIVFSVPASQAISEHSIDASALICVSFSEENAFKFSNAVSLLKFTMPLDNIKSVTLRDINGTKFSGKTTITLSEQISTACAGSTSITLTNESGFVKDNIYYLALAPCKFASGLQIIYATDDEKGILSSKKEFVFERNSGKDIGSVNPTWIPSITGITTLSQLKAFAVCADIYTADDVVNLGADIDVLEQNWTPIRAFKGSFDGHNHHIYNIKCIGTANRQGLFSTVGASSGTNSVIKNLCVGSQDYDFDTMTGTHDGVSQFEIDSQDNSDWRYIGVIGYAHNNTTIDNVINFAPLSITEASCVRFRLGGIVGTSKASVTIKNCRNYGNITANDFVMVDPINRNVSIGGITGAIDGNNCLIHNCYNKGDIKNYNESACHIGGIVGVTQYLATISNCKNDGTVENAGTCIGKDSGYAVRTGGITGGIAGDNALGSQIIECVNNGNIYFSGSIVSEPKVYNATTGGICGVTTVSSSIKGCQNNGEVAIKTPITQNCCIGGILGYSTGSSNVTLITDSENGVKTKNTANLIQKEDYGATLYSGGIVGSFNSSKSSLIENAENTGQIKLTTKQTSKKSVYLGGIAGSCGAMIKNCHNTGLIHSTAGNNDTKAYFGGIAGGTAEFAEISQCTNDGTIQIGKGDPASRFGGICATLKGASKLSNCTNNGKLYCTRGASVLLGGIAAYAELTSGTKTCLNDCVCKFLLHGSPTALNGNAGLVVGQVKVTEGSTLTFGEPGHEIQLTGCTSIIYNSKEADTPIPIDSSNYTDYLLGKTTFSAIADGKVVFNTVF